ncbi:MAG: apolipoprotein N-acyltransferase, partial [Nitrospirota bacterium]|nr:apolipoprotein N-acyltransferase [Nitrospirota bacterium]
MSGVLLIPAFPPYDIYPLAWIALIPLLAALWKKNIKASFALGFLTGFIYFLGTVYWVFNSMYYHGSVPAVMSGLMLALLCGYLALYVGAFSVFFNIISEDTRIPSLVLVPVVWVSLELFRTYALSGFPWSVLGYSQYKLLPLIQIADMTGIYGVSFIVAALNGAMFDVAVWWPKKSREMPLLPRWPLIACLLVCLVVLAGVVLYGHAKLKEEESGKKIRVALVQGNIEQDKKWDVRFQKDVIDTYKRLSSDAAKDSPDLIVWPETALPFVLGHNKALSDEITLFQKGLDSHLLTGSVVAKSGGQYANSAVLLSPGGAVMSVYDKMHLVPYGEYVPFRQFMPFIEKLVVAVGDFVPGKETV